MLTFSNDQNPAHAREPAPATQRGFCFEGDRVLRFETPARAADRQAALTARGLTRTYTSHAFSIDRRSIKSFVCTPRDLAFPEHGWRDWLAVESRNSVGQPFSSVWQVRMLRKAGCGAGLWFEVLEIVCARIAIDGAEVLAVCSGQDTVANNLTSRFALLARNFSLVGGRSAQLGLPNVFEAEVGYAANWLVANAVNLIEGFEGG